MTTPNSFVWYELMTRDAKAATAFYGHVIGWRPTDSGMPGMDYTIMHAGDVPMGGMMALTQAACDAGARPGWVGYVGVGDVDGAVERLTKAGGAVHVPPSDIPGVGRFSVVADPQGAVFTLFKGASDEVPTAPAGATPGFVGWHELYAVDGASAFDFYAAMFGWSHASTFDMGPMGQYRIFSIGSAPIGGIMTKPDTVSAPGWTYYFRVEDTEAAAQRVTQNGGKVLMGPHQVPGGDWIAQCQDPQGVSFAVVGPDR